MIAANDTDTSFLLEMAPDQLRMLIAHAGGILAYRVGDESAARSLWRIGERILRDPNKGPDWLRNKATLPQSVRDQVIREVSEETGVTPEEILSSSRNGKPTRARALVMWRLREMVGDNGLPKYSYPVIGRAMGRDHTTVVHACVKMRARLAIAQGDASAERSGISA